MSARRHMTTRHPNLTGSFLEQFDRDRLGAHFPPTTHLSQQQTPQATPAPDSVFSPSVTPLNKTF
ncbi:MAG: hypothetical protein CM15mV149_050 [uncultured marine virus]|nr:MAG: hypothetical protein CM15mV149_050 [uncultured marine virus]